MRAVRVIAKEPGKPDKEQIIQFRYPPTYHPTKTVSAS